MVPLRPGKTVLLSCIVLMLVLTACSGRKHESQVPANVNPELMELFELYAINEGRETGEKIMQFFNDDIEVFLRTYTEHGGHEWLLILIGTWINEAYMRGDLSYLETLDKADRLTLSAEATAHLNFMKANVDYWRNH